MTDPELEILHVSRALLPMATKSGRSWRHGLRFPARGVESRLGLNSVLGEGSAPGEDGSASYRASH